MTIKQISGLLNQVVSQAYGKTAVTVTADLTGLIAMGDMVLSSVENTDAFCHALVDRIGYTIFSSRPYRGFNHDIVRRTFEYGCILQKIYVAPMEAVDAPQWNLQAGQSVDQYVVNIPDVKQKLFDGVTPWEIDITIPDKILKSAFTSFELMATFIDQIFMSVENSLAKQLETVGSMAIANFAAELINAHKNAVSGIHCIHLLQEFNTAMGTSYTAEKALLNLDFLKWATRQINLYVDRFANMGVQFNVENYVRHTPKEYVRVKMLADFTTAASYYLQSDTFHNDLTALPLYSEIPFWQGSQAYSFKENSTINVITSDGNTINQDGVVALITDIEAIAMMVDDRRIRSVRNERGEYTQYFNKADIRYLNDLSENGLVFTVTDTPIQPATPTNETAPAARAKKSA